MAVVEIKGSKGFIFQSYQTYCLLSPSLRDEIFDDFKWLTCSAASSSVFRRLDKVLCCTTLTGYYSSLLLKLLFNLDEYCRMLYLLAKF